MPNVNLPEIISFTVPGTTVAVQFHVAQCPADVLINHLEYGLSERANNAGNSAAANKKKPVTKEAGVLAWVARMYEMPRETGNLGDPVVREMINIYMTFARDRLSWSHEKADKLRRDEGLATAYGAVAVLATDRDATMESALARAMKRMDDIDTALRAKAERNLAENKALPIDVPL